MQTLRITLRDSDPGVLAGLADVWGVKTKPAKMTDKAFLQELETNMTQPDRVEQVWDRLTDDERGALQLLMASGRKMRLSQFELAFGQIRKLGRKQIEQGKPYYNPDNVAEALYFRGLISQGMEQTNTGMHAVVYVPDDLALLLPTHKTMYANLQDEPDTFMAAIETLTDDELEEVTPADTSIVDDLTTLLAYLRINSANIENGNLIAEDRQAIAPHLLTRNDRRLAFLFALGITADLITTQEGQAYPKRNGIQHWLSASRHQQVKQLADAWRGSTIYLELWSVPGLHPDPTGFPYDMLVAREAFIGFLKQFVPHEGWWSFDDFIETIKAADPDFQRPGGDYDSWYIRNDDGEYLRGYESWDAVEGALLEFYVTGPMHWLGLVDLAENAARLTAYGRAFIGLSPWPNPPERHERITVDDDGTLWVSRKVSRVDRFQVARFTTWVRSGDTYEYKLDADGIQRAEAQGITTQHISAFLSRQSDEALPDFVTRLLETWQGGAAAEVTFERLLVLRTVSPDVLDRIYEDPALRRYLGAKLGPMACIIRDDYADALRGALGTYGYHVEVFE